ncbi:DNA/RNA non-specific endonuclease [Roseateles cellulosilyticus]|uniref:DNA/RNA non-specific endonuclease n=1 Tax=Pelomonas cellulosilytica TaxID=2906762 RepID=A0ABS8XLL0_9BURK|nr:DNA/RNA non-specific endonuclease [Pelomonas sp. P8]MCE4553689.1 DNA/RNA non-specific endonuclease [Pelomonas sp. P8]
MVPIETGTRGGHMGVKLGELMAAAQRYVDYKAHQRVDPQAAAIERMHLGLRNARDFTSKSDRLNVLANAVLQQPQAAALVAGVPPPLLDPAVAIPEALFADNDLRPVRYLQIALLAARAVGKLTVRGMVDEEGDATGFLVAPGLLMTNHHVLPDATYASVSFVAFDQEDDVDGRPKTPKLFDLLPRQLYVSDKELDYCLVAVSPKTSQDEPLSQFGYLRLFEETGKVDPNRRQAANIIQHPLGQGKKVALRDNYFEEPPKDALDALGAQNSLFYGTDTLKGSSGSPVCTDEWYVVALHRGGVPKVATKKGQRVVLRRDGTPAREGDAKRSIQYETNEGTRVSRIYASLKAKVAMGGTDAGPAAQALERMLAVAQDPSVGPVERATHPLVVPPTEAEGEAGVEEKLVRKPLDFVQGPGYQPGFLGAGFQVALPSLSSEVRKEVAPLKDGSGHVLNYLHYSLVVNAERRTAFFAACNVDGRQLWKVVHPGTSVGKRPTAWGTDPRMDEKFQPDDSIFSTAVQRGHLFKREDASWGADDELRQRSDLQSFMIANATPMFADFNNNEWGNLEDIVSRHVMSGRRVSYFAGPIFSVDDPYFNELKAGVPASLKRQGMRVPTRFWKIVAWVEAGRLQAAGFVLDQSDEIREHGPITEEIDFGSYRPRPIKEIQSRTGLKFPKLVAADTFAQAAVPRQ